MSRSGSNQARIRARRCVVQALYQWLVAGTHPESIVEEFIEGRELIKVDLDYFSELTRKIPINFEALLSKLEPVIDRDWARIDPVEKAILLIGVYELNYCMHIPWRVAVNEGVELCKMFGAEDAHRYVNGVLDKVARECRSAEIERPAPVKL